MVTFARTLGMGALVAASLLVVPISAAAKCDTRPFPNVEVPPVPDYMIDGVPATASAFDALDPGNIESVRLLCREERNAETGEVVWLQTVVWTVTSGGLESTLGRILQDLLAAQEEIKAKTGRYTAIRDLFSSSLSFALPAYGDLRITASEGGWSASVGGDAGRSCYIAVGEIASPHPDLTPGVPACFPIQVDSGA